MAASVYIFINVKVSNVLHVLFVEVQVIKTAQKGSRYKVGENNASVTGQQCTFPVYCPMNLREEISDLDTSLHSFSSNYEV